MLPESVSAFVPSVWRSHLFSWNDHGLAPLVRIGIAIGGAYVGFYLPNIFISNLIQRRQKSIGKCFRMRSTSF